MRLPGRVAYSMYLTRFFVLCTFSCWFFLRLQGRVPRAVWASAIWVLSAVWAPAGYQECGRHTERLEFVR